MKKYTLFLLASLLSTMAFAQILPDDVVGDWVMSGEVEVVEELDAAPEESETGITLVSGEIDIVLPYDPLEEADVVFDAADDDYALPAYSLSAATYVQTGPGSILFLMLIATLGTAATMYYIRTRQED